MAVSQNLSRWLFAILGLGGGVALGTLLPADSARSSAAQGKGEGAVDGIDAGGAGGGLRVGSSGVTGQGGFRKGAAGDEAPGLDLKGGEALGKMPPERVLQLFEKVSNLRSESRKYILAYRLASKLELGQIEGALKAALQDLSDGDYVTTRALARRWVELDPKAAADKALETKQQHMVIPVMESWTRVDPAAPLSWALRQSAELQADAVRPLLMGRLLDAPQLEKLVMNSAGSESEEMRKQIFPFAASRMAESNPQGALHAASSVEDPDLRQRTLMMVLGRLGQTAPEAGKAWLASQADLAPELRQQLEQALNNPRGGGRPKR